MRLSCQIGDSPGYFGRTIDACLTDGADDERIVNRNTETFGLEQMELGLLLPVIPEPAIARNEVRRPKN
jgi:hypothetical protein